MFREKARQYKDSLLFLQNNLGELTSKYDNHWIAVYQSEVISNAESIEELQRVMTDLGVPLTDVLVQFITRKKVVTIY